MDTKHRIKQPISDQRMKKKKIRPATIILDGVTVEVIPVLRGPEVCLVWDALKQRARELGVSSQANDRHFLIQHQQDIPTEFAGTTFLFIDDRDLTLPRHFAHVYFMGRNQGEKKHCRMDYFFKGLCHMGDMSFIRIRRGNTQEKINRILS